jgi:hypothetical protein
MWRVWQGLRDPLLCDKAFLCKYEVHEAGGKAHREYWIPADDLPAFNAALIGEIEVIAEFP